MAKLEAVYKSLDNLSSFLQPALPFVNAHLVEFFTKSLWENLPPKLQGIPSATIIEHLQNHKQNNTQSQIRMSQGTVDFMESSLQDMVHNLNVLSLDKSEVCISAEEFPDSCRGANKFSTLGLKESDWKFDRFMSSKKMHEVEMMSEFVTRVSKHNALNNCGDNTVESSPDQEYIVDIGSGKGYLSSFLTLLYKFKVLAIDGKVGNTKGCEDRVEKLNKCWASLIRRALERRATGNDVLPKRGKKWKSNQLKLCQTGIVPSGDDNVSESSSSLCDEDEDETVEDKNSRLKNITMFVTADNISEDFLRKLLIQSFPELKSQDPDVGFGIIGLHTCGDLGVNSLRLFLNNSDARFVLNVPCCHHHLEESDSRTTSDRRSKFWDELNDALTPGPIRTFPMSQFLQKKKFRLGRNARMMSSHSLDRLSRDEKDMQLPRSLLYRTLVEVLLKERLGHTTFEHTVGRIPEKKYSSFQEYVAKALKRLHLTHLKFSETELESVYQRHEHLIETLHSYILIRAMFAPLVEGCVLLDRLAFLLEQEIVQSAFLVRLFDPVISPRSHAILAFKRERDGSRAVMKH